MLGKLSQTCLSSWPETQEDQEEASPLSGEIATMETTTTMATRTGGLRSQPRALRATPRQARAQPSGRRGSRGGGLASQGEAGRRGGEGPAARKLLATAEGIAAQTSTSTSDAQGTEATSTTPKKICVVGGGFGGLYAALRLSTLVWPGKSKPEITLIDQRDRFVFKPLLYELLTDELELDEVAPRFSDLLSRSGVSFVQGKVTGVSAKDEETGVGAVSLEGDEGKSVEYDYLVVAFGSGTRLDMVEGAEEHATPFCNLEDAVDLKSYLREETKKGATPSLAVVGGGVNGVELAASLADKFGDKVAVQVITPGSDILESYPKDQRQNAWNTLSQGKVDVRLGTKVTRVALEEEAGKFALTVENDQAGGDTLRVDKVLWTAGQKPATVPVRGGQTIQGEGFFSRNDEGNVVTDNTLRMVNSSYVFALGDIAVQEGDKTSKFAFTAQVAFQQSDYVAWNVWSTINGQPLLPFQYQHLGDMMSLGQNQATVALPIGGLSLTGLPASLLRKSAYVYRMPTLESQARLGLNWGFKLLNSFL